MSTRIDLHAVVGLTGGGTVDLTIGADLSLLDVDGLELVGNLLDLIGRHALAVRVPAPAEQSDVPEPPVVIDRVEPEAAPPAAKASATPRTNGHRPRADGDMGVRMLRALHEAGGELFDPSGRAAAKLFEAAGVDVGPVARNVLAILDDEGYVTRTKKATTTSRIVLLPKGLGLVERVDEPEAPEPAPTPTSTSKGVASMCLTGQCALCAALTCTHDCHRIKPKRATA